MMVNAILFVVLGFLLMEFSGWFIHKFLMHGILWNIHKTHHLPKKGVLELNDIFSVLFGGVSVLLMWKGFESLDYRFWIGLGISIYGLCYFLLHDVLIHRRNKWLKRPNSGLFAGIFKAHQAHHANNQKKGAEAFGLFVVPRKYFKEGKK